MLLDMGASRIRAIDVDRSAVARASHALADPRCEVIHGDGSASEVLQAESEILVPCARGPVISPANAGTVKARIVCGPQLDAVQTPAISSRILASKGTAFVPAEVAGRAVLSVVANEIESGLAFDTIFREEQVLRELASSNPDGIAQTVQLLLQDAGASWQDTDGVAEVRRGDGFANMMLSLEGSGALDAPHPLWPNACKRIITALLERKWHLGNDAERRIQERIRTDQRLQKGTGLDADARWLESTVYGGWKPGSRSPLQNEEGRNRLPKGIPRRRQPRIDGGLD